MGFMKFMRQPSLKHRLNVLEERFVVLEKEKEEKYDRVKVIVRNMLYEMVTNETINVQSIVDGKKIDTKLVANQTKLLQEKRFALERALERCDEALEIAEGEEI